jgi:hypothetical protein
MMQSENINELVTALAKAQGEIQPAAKDSTNPHFKSRYADLSSVWDACRLPLSKNGLAVMQTTAVVNDKLTVVTTLAHSSGQWMRSELPVLVANNNPQALGSALTYMRRYALSAIVGVAPGDDDDGNAAAVPSGTAVQMKEKVLINKEQMQSLSEVLDNCDQKYLQTIWNYLKKNGINSLEQIPVSYYDRLYNGAVQNAQGEAVNA